MSNWHRIPVKFSISDTTTEIDFHPSGDFIAGGTYNNYCRIYHIPSTNDIKNSNQQEQKEDATALLMEKKKVKVPLTQEEKEKKLAQDQKNAVESVPTGNHPKSRKADLQQLFDLFPQLPPRKAVDLLNTHHNNVGKTANFIIEQNYIATLSSSDDDEEGEGDEEEPKESSKNSNSKEDRIGPLYQAKISDQAYCAQFSHDGKKAGYGSYTQNIHFFPFDEKAARELVFKNKTHKNKMEKARQIETAHESFSVSETTVGKFGGSGRGFAFFNDDDRFVVGTAGGQVQFWRRSTNSRCDSDSVQQFFRSHIKQTCGKIALSPCEKFVAMHLWASSDNLVLAQINDQDSRSGKITEAKEIKSFRVDNVSTGSVALGEHHGFSPSSDFDYAGEGKREVSVFPLGIAGTSAGPLFFNYKTGAVLGTIKTMGDVNTDGLDLGEDKEEKKKNENKSKKEGEELRKVKKQLRQEKLSTSISSSVVYVAMTRDARFAVFGAGESMYVVEIPRVLNPENFLPSLRLVLVEKFGSTPHVAAFSSEGRGRVAGVVSDDMRIFELNPWGRRIDVWRVRDLSKQRTKIAVVLNEIYAVNVIVNRFVA